MSFYTIGFTHKTAEAFFEGLRHYQIDTVIDVRLNNTSQLASFAKFPDIQYFLKEIIGVSYFHDKTFAPTDDLLKRYRQKKTSWAEYKLEFEEIMRSRNIDTYIRSYYAEMQNQNLCFLCSEATADECHRRLVAQHFSEIFMLPITHI